MKTYHSYQSELRQIESKLRAAETQRSKLEQTLSQDKLERSKKYKLMEKEVVKVKSFFFIKKCYYTFNFSEKINIQMRN